MFDFCKFHHPVNIFIANLITTKCNIIQCAPIFMKALLILLANLHLFHYVFGCNMKKGNIKMQNVQIIMLNNIL